VGGEGTGPGVNAFVRDWDLAMGKNYANLKEDTLDIKKNPTQNNPGRLKRGIPDLGRLAKNAKERKQEQNNHLIQRINYCPSGKVGGHRSVSRKGKGTARGNSGGPMENAKKRGRKRHRTLTKQ